jgi:hypothetical protein
MKKLLLITISLSIAYWGVLLAVEYSWTLPIPFLIIVTIWYFYSICNKPKYKIVNLKNKYGILRIEDKYMLDMNEGIVHWFSAEELVSQYCYTEDKEKVERYLEQLNNN